MSRRALLPTFALLVLFTLPLLTEILGSRRLVFRDAQITHWPWRRVAVASLASGRGPVRQRRGVRRPAAPGQSQRGAPLPDVPARARRPARCCLQPALPRPHPLGLFRRETPGPRPRPLGRGGVLRRRGLRLLRDEPVVRLGLHELDRRRVLAAVVRGRRRDSGSRLQPRRGGPCRCGRRSGARTPAARRRTRVDTSDARLLRDARSRRGARGSACGTPAPAPHAFGRRSGRRAPGPRRRGPAPSAAAAGFPADLPGPAPLLGARLRSRPVLLDAGRRMAAAALRGRSGLARRRGELADFGRRAEPGLHLVRDVRHHSALRPAARRRRPRLLDAAGPRPWPRAASSRFSCRSDSRCPSTD